MFELFEEVFAEVMAEGSYEGWWELFDGEGFEEVERRIAERYGVEDAYEVEGFSAWASEMAMEL